MGVDVGDFWWGVEGFQALSVGVQRCPNDSGKWNSGLSVGKNAIKGVRLAPQQGIYQSSDSLQSGQNY